MGCQPSVARCHSDNDDGVVKGKTKGNIIGGSCHKYHFCRDKSLTRVCLNKTHIFSRQAYCILLSRRKNKTCFVSTKICLSRQAYFYRDKTRLLSRQTRVCHDKPMITKWWQDSSQTQAFLSPVEILLAVPSILLLVPSHLPTTLQWRHGFRRRRNESLLVTI